MDINEIKKELNAVKEWLSANKNPSPERNRKIERYELLKNLATAEKEKTGETSKGHKKRFQELTRWLEEEPEDHPDRRKVINEKNRLEAFLRMLNAKSAKKKLTQDTLHCLTNILRENLSPAKVEEILKEAESRALKGQFKKGEGRFVDIFS